MPNAGRWCVIRIRENTSAAAARLRPNGPPAQFSSCKASVDASGKTACHQSAHDWLVEMFGRQHITG